MHAGFLVIGGGLSGLGAAIRLARFNNDVLLLEKHSRIGGLNSYYYRNHRLFETGLHAITNYAERGNKKAPLNRLLRQLKIKRDEIGLHQQIKSEICFPGQQSLLFSNDFDELLEEIHSKFRKESQGFTDLVNCLEGINPFEDKPFRSTRQVLASFLKDPLLIDMLLCPILYYGSSWENDIDLNQFVIMFRSLFQEGMFRPAGTIKDFLDLLVARLEGYGGTIKMNCGVKSIIVRKKKAIGVILENGEEITCDKIVSTIGLNETKVLLGQPLVTPDSNRLGFTENIFQVKAKARLKLPADRTIVFFNTGRTFAFQQPQAPVDFSSGVICLPFNFQGLEPQDDFIEVRTTHLANYTLWHKVSSDKSSYMDLKKKSMADSLMRAESIIGKFSEEIVYTDSFTPITIERFTGKHGGAIYGSPTKVRDGMIGYDNLIIAGTDQGFLGIVGSMLSGVSMVNQHVLSKLQ